MNGKPKNWSALCKSVQAADLNMMPSQRMNGKRADKLILDCLALHANELGKGAHPGNKALMKACGLEWRQVHEHLALQIKAGIIVRTHVGNGAWNASVYDIIYTNPIFPDHSENGRECFLASCPNHPVTPNHAVSDSPNHAVKAEENSKPCGYEAPNHAVSVGNHAVSESNHAVTMPHDILIPSESQQNPPSKPPAPQSGADGWREFLENLRPCPEMEMAPMNKKVEGQLRERVVQHGGKLMARTACWWFKYRPQGIAGMKMSPWFFFVKEYEPYLREAIDNMPGPDGKTPAQRREDEMVDAAAARMAQNAGGLGNVSQVDDDEEVEETRRMLKGLSK